VRRHAALWLLLASGACIEEQRYVVQNEAIVLTVDSAPVAVDDDGEPTLFLVERRFEFPITPPAEDAFGLLRMQAQGLMLPYPRLPWVRLSALEIELDYVIANLEERRVTAGMVVNGFNEFHEYAPGPDDFSQWERLFALAPLERRTGTLTERDLHEVAVDLATVVNGAPNSNLVVQFQSQSSRDERVKPFIPAVVPGLLGLRVGVLAAEAANVAVEISVRVQDHGGRLAERGKTRWQQPTPELFTPVVPEEEP
jgi:hypothetical protein